MANKLTHKCDVCSSWFWCGRPCGRAPDESISLDDGSEVVFAGGEPIASSEGGGIILDVTTGSASPQPTATLGEVLPSYKYRDPVKRRAYMKEYMRKRRAKKGDDA